MAVSWESTANFIRERSNQRLELFRSRESSMRQYRISVEVTSASKEEAIAAFERVAESLRSSSYAQTVVGYGGGGSAASSGLTFSGPVPMTLEDRVSELEDRQAVAAIK